MWGRIRRLCEFSKARALGLADVLGAAADRHELTSLVLQIPAAKDLGPILRDHPNAIGGGARDCDVLLTAGEYENTKSERGNYSRHVDLHYEGRIVARFLPAVKTLVIR